MTDTDEKRRANCKIITNARCDDLFEMLEQRLARFSMPGI